MSHESEPVSAERVHDLVITNRAIRSPAYRAGEKGVQWGEDIIPALLGLFRVEKEPRDDRPNGWVGYAVLPEGYEPEYARDWQANVLRLEFDVTAKSSDDESSDDDAVLVVTAMSPREGAQTIDEEDIGTVDIPDSGPTHEAWDERIRQYQAVRRSDDSAGSASVKAYIAALPGWKCDLAKRIDAIIEREVPAVRRVVKWHAPFYGVDGEGWFASFSPLSNALKLTFMRGASLDPKPPGGKRDDARWLDLPSADALDEKQVASWVRQASALAGWGS